MVRLVISLVGRSEKPQVWTYKDTPPHTPQPQENAWRFNKRLGNSKTERLVQGNLGKRDLTRLRGGTQLTNVHLILWISARIFLQSNQS